MVACRIKVSLIYYGLSRNCFAGISHVAGTHSFIHTSTKEWNFILFYCALFDVNTIFVSFFILNFLHFNAYGTKVPYLCICKCRRCWTTGLTTNVMCVCVNVNYRINFARYSPMPTANVIAQHTITSRLWLLHNYLPANFKLRFFN